MRTAALHNLGCKVNAYETEAMRQILEEGGYTIVPFTEKADVYVINTCSVTNIADRKSRQMIHRARRRNPDAVIVATGCYVQAQANRMHVGTEPVESEIGGAIGLERPVNGNPLKADKKKETGKSAECTAVWDSDGRTEAEELGADIIIGNNKKHELLTFLDEFFQGKSESAIESGREEVNAEWKTNAEIGQVSSVSTEIKSMVRVININDRSEPYEELAVAAPTRRAYPWHAEHTRAFVKVQDGCNQFCSYCIIPYVRGRVRSRSLENVLEEVRGLAAKGYREIVLTGIHLSSYGVGAYGKGGETQHDGEQEDVTWRSEIKHDEVQEDRKDSDSVINFGMEKKESQMTVGLLDLIRAVCAVDGIKRVRLGSLEPQIVTEEFARELAALPEVCPHFHLSLQSGCDETLRRMNRRYTTAEYEEGCRLLRKYFDDPAITTDVIAGFPGETEEEFAATKEFLERIHFYEMHIFKYSRRKGTRADRMPDQVPEQVKSARSEELIALGERMSQEYRQRHIGLQREALLEEPVEIGGRKYHVGYTPEYIKVAVPIDAGAVQAGSIVSGRIAGRLQDEIYLLA